LNYKLGAVGIGDSSNPIDAKLHVKPSFNDNMVAGIYAESSGDASITRYAIYAKAINPTNVGVFGRSGTNPSLSSVGVWGQTDHAGVGVRGTDVLGDGCRT